MIKLHHLNNSRSQRVIWALEELGLDFEIESYQRDPTTYLAPEKLKEVHPLGKAPILEDGENKIAESAVIIDYLVNQYAPNLKPEINTEEYLNYQYWMHYAEGSLMPYLVMKLVFDKVKTSPMPFFARPIAKKIAEKATSNFIRPNLVTHLSYINHYLNGRSWFCGDALSGVDFQMIFPLEAACARGLATPETHPNISNYVASIHARPAYQAAIDAAGDYDYA